MATVVNDRDVLLQAAGQRYTASSGSALLIAPSAPSFNVDVGGTPTPSSITLNAVRINVAGPATFSTSDGSTLTVNGDTATLAYANMQNSSVTVTVSVTDGGTVHSRSTTITKVRDGASGTGTTGQRGAGTYQASGSAWSDAVAHAATPGETVVDDQVIIWNGTNFAEQRRWDGSNWVAAGLHMPGDVIVPGTIIGNKLKAGTVELFATDGVTKIISLGGGLHPDFAAPGTKNSDLDIGIGTGNKIVNSGPYRGSAGPFVVGYNSTGQAVTFAPSQDPYRPLGVGGVHIAFPATTPASGTVCDISDEVRPVLPNQRYEFSAYVAGFRCNTQLYIAWLKENGAASDIKPWSMGTVDPGTGAVGESLSNWYRGKLFDTAPADAAKAQVVTRMVSTGEANPYLFTSMWYFGTALQAQTVPSEWSDGASGTSALIDAATAKSAADSAAQAAAAAQQDADTANADIFNITADSVLSRDEKTVLVQIHETIQREIDGVWNSADALGLATLRNAYWSAWVTLRDNMPSGWWDTSYDTTGIDRAAFNLRFTNYYQAKQNLLNGVTSELKTRAANAQAAADTANNGLADKLSKSAASALAATITLQTNGVLLAGDTTNGVYMHSSGLVGVQGGVVKFSVPISGNPIFAGMLQAAFGSFGAVTIDASGSFSSGQTAYDTGTGWWMGFVGGVPKLSIGTAGGSALLWDGTTLKIRQAQLEGTSLGGPALTLSGSSSPMYFTYTRSITGGNAGTITASASGTGLSYSWTIEGNAGNRVLYSINGHSAANIQLSVNGGGAVGMFDWYVTCTVTDTKGLSVTKTMIVTVDLQ